MNFGPNTLALAENAIDDRTAEAVIDAIRAADAQGLERADIDTIRHAAVKHRARLRSVAACLGFLRCESCGAWIDAACEPREDNTGCPHVGEADRADVYGGLAIYRVCGGELNCSHSIPRGVAKRLRNQKTATPTTPELSQSPAAPPTGDAMAV